jgi:hypothetical protein
MIGDLRRESPEFRRFWDEARDFERVSGVDEQLLNHPTNGPLRYEQISFNVVGCPDFTLTVLIQMESNLTMVGPEAEASVP